MDKTVSRQELVDEVLSVLNKLPKQEADAILREFLNGRQGGVKRGAN